MNLEPRGSANHLQLCAVEVQWLPRDCSLHSSGDFHCALFQLSTAAFSAALNFRDTPLAKSPSSSPPIAVAPEPQDFDSQRRQHPPDLPVLAFLEHNFQPGIAFPAPQFAHALH